MNLLKLVRTTLTAAGLLIAANGALCADEVPHVTAPVIATFSLRSDSVTLGEPVWIDYVVRNTTADSVTIQLGHNRKANFRIVVTPPDRRSIETPRLSSEGMGLIGRVLIPAAHTYRQELLLDEWYDVDAPGQYEIAIGLGDEAPQVLRLQVLERDPVKLEAVAKALHNQALSPDVETADRAALALSSIDDPIAVPFLANLLSRKQPLAARGLGRIGTPEAIDALLANLPEPHIAVHSAVRAELMMLRDTVSDPVMRRRIDAALEGDRRVGVKQ